MSKRVPTPAAADLWSSLSGSVLNTALLNVFVHQARKLTPAKVLQAFKNNRLVRPGRMNPLVLKKLELEALKMAEDKGFRVVELSPVAPLGSCSVVAPVHQNNVLSASRGAEVVADATNILALIMAQEWQKAPAPSALKYACTHRHVRTQAYDHPDYSPHFCALALSTGGLDKGHYFFEVQALIDHIGIHYQLLRQKFPDQPISLTWWVRRPAEQLISRLQTEMAKTWPQLPQEWIIPAPAHPYYPVIQFKLYLHLVGKPLDLADGGLVDWTQKLLTNRKHRLVISGLGLELMMAQLGK